MFGDMGFIARDLMDPAGDYIDRHSLAGIMPRYGLGEIDQAINTPRSPRICLRLTNGPGMKHPVGDQIFGQERRAEPVVIGWMVGIEGEMMAIDLAKVITG